MLNYSPTTTVGHNNSFSTDFISLCIAATNSLANTEIPIVFDRPNNIFKLKWLMAQHILYGMYHFVQKYMFF